MIKIPITEKKIPYLQNIINEGKLQTNIHLDIRRQQFIIHSHDMLPDLKKRWYKDNEKVFSDILDPQLIPFPAIILCINLFGVRKLETIAIPTTIHKNYIKSVSFCMEHHLKVPVVSTANQIKITNIPKVIARGLEDIPTYHSAEFVNFLTLKEKKQMIEGV